MVALIACGSRKTPKIREVVEGLGCQVTIHDIETLDWEPILSCDRIIISGSPILLTDSPEKAQLFESLSGFNKPILGICFGHQVLGILDGAEIHIGQHIGQAETINTLRESPLFDSLPESFRVDQSHCEWIDLPSGWSLVADSSSCPVEAMQHDVLPRFGVQFHPETSGAVGKKIIENFLTVR